MCTGCNKDYTDETLGSIKKRINEHIRDLKIGDDWKVLANYNLETKHSFNFKDSKLFVVKHYKQYRRIVEFILFHVISLVKLFS